MTKISDTLPREDPCEAVHRTHGVQARRVALHMAGSAVIGAKSHLTLKPVAMDTGQTQCAFLAGFGKPMAWMQTAFAGWITDEIWQPNFLDGQDLTTAEKDHVIDACRSFIAAQAPSTGAPSDRTERDHFRTYWQKTVDVLTEVAEWGAVVIVARTLLTKGKIDAACVQDILDQRRLVTRPIGDLVDARLRVKNRADAAYKIFST